MQDNDNALDTYLASAPEPIKTDEKTPLEVNNQLENNNDDTAPYEQNQWQHGGDCDKCRREPYCKKECTAHKRWKHETMQRLFAHYRELLKKHNQPTEPIEPTEPKAEEGE